MIIQRAEDLTGSPRDARGPGWTSLRLLTQEHGMGYTMTDTRVAPGTVLTLEYAHHLEACYCLSGHGTVTDLATGEVHALAPGTLYALDRHDRHELRCGDGEALRLICTFSPALKGDETHDAAGGYGG